MKNGALIMMEKDRLEVTHLMGKKLDKPIMLKLESETKKNKMEEFAKLFDKKLGEEFTIKRSLGFDFEGHFSERGFVFWGKDATNNEGWYSDDGRLILELLTGKAVITNE